MTTASRLAAYGAVLTLTFGGAWALGAQVGPALPAAWAAAEHVRPADDPGSPADASGYRMVLDPSAPAGEFAFTVTGPDGRPVSGSSGPPASVVLVRTDGGAHQLLAPELGADHVWRSPLAPLSPGLYRALADLPPGCGPRLQLSTELFVPGTPRPAPTGLSRVWQGDGYQVRLDGDLVPGSASQVFATVTKDGAAVTDLQPHLGGFGGLAVLRLPDLAPLAVRADGPAPTAVATTGPSVAFVVDVPEAGTYRVYFDFLHDGATHGAAFTVATREAP